MNRTTLFRSLATTSVLLLLACSEKENPAPGSGGAGGSTPKGGSGGSASGGSGGSASTGTGGSAPGGSGGTSTGGSGAGGAASGGASGSGGKKGGDAGPATDSGGGAGIAIAGKLHKYVHTLKCIRPNPQDTRRSCFAAEEDVNRKTTIMFGGDPAVTYDVTIRVRGNVEPRGYQGGMLQDMNNPWFYVGGTPGGPSDNALYNQYKILVAEPKQVYYLNANSKGVLPSSSKDHDTWKIDYSAKLKIKGGTTVDVASEDRPSGMNSNFLNVKVEGVPMELVNQEPNGFPGQFFYLEVESVTPGA